MTRPATYNLINALQHVQECVQESGRHDITSCPLHSRAMCQHKLAVKWMILNGILKEDGQLRERHEPPQE